MARAENFFVEVLYRVGVGSESPTGRVGNYDYV